METIIIGGTLLIPTNGIRFADHTVQNTAASGITVNEIMEYIQANGLPSGTPVDIGMF